MQEHLRVPPLAVDDALIESLRRPLPLWFGLVGRYAATRVLTLPAEAAPIEGRVFPALLIVSLTLWLSDVAVRLISLAASRRSKESAPLAGAVQLGVRATVLATGALVLISSLGISVTPVLTTAGIGGLAVALGLQDDVSNLVAVPVGVAEFEPFIRCHTHGFVKASARRYAAEGVVIPFPIRALEGLAGASG